MKLDELLARWEHKQAYIYVHRFHTFRPIPDRTVDEYLAGFDMTITRFEAGVDEMVRFGPPWVINIYVDIAGLGQCHFQIKGL